MEHRGARERVPGPSRPTGIDCQLDGYEIADLGLGKKTEALLDEVGTLHKQVLALRDATAVSVQSGLGMRNQEIWALTLGDVAGRRATVHEVLSYGALDAGKTEGATGPSRRPPIDALLADDLTAWKAALAAHGYPTATDDFLRRGDLGGQAHQTAT